MRVTIASTSPAVPKIRPDWIASTVLVPTTCGGAASSTRVSRAVRENRLAALACMPGAITPPTNSPLSLTTSKFVAVPKSTTIAGPPVSVNAASAFTTRSAPTSRGLSVSTGTPVFTPGPTITGANGK